MFLYSLIGLFISIFFGIYITRIITRRKTIISEVSKSVLKFFLILPPAVFIYIVFVGYTPNTAIIILTSVLSSIPHIYQNLKDAFLSVDHLYEDGARALGASESRIFLTVTIPMSIAGLIKSSVIGYIRLLGELILISILYDTGFNISSNGLLLFFLISCISIQYVNYIIKVRYTHENVNIR